MDGQSGVWVDVGLFTIFLKGEMNQRKSCKVSSNTGRSGFRLKQNNFGNPHKINEGSL